LAPNVVPKREWHRAEPGSRSVAVAQRVMSKILLYIVFAFLLPGAVAWAGFYEEAGLVWLAGLLALGILFARQGWPWRWGNGRH